MKRLFCLAFIFLVLKNTEAGDPTSFYALAIEGSPSSDDPVTNLNTYIGYIDTISDSSFTHVDVIVLPEYGLTGIKLGDDAKKAAEKIDENADFIKAWNNLANKENMKYDTSTYLIANMLEKDGDDDDTKYYSTTVAVQNGKIVQKYRKINVHPLESSLSSGEDIITFQDKNIGGTIALMAGEDILYENPSQKIFTNANETTNATTIFYTAGLQSLAPFQAALSIQQGYAQANGINLIVANFDDTKDGLGGSGIFSVKEVKQQTISEKERNVAIYSQITIIDKRETCQKPESFSSYSSKSLKVNKDKTRFNFTKDKDLFDDLVTQEINGDLSNEELCDGDFCCTFTINAEWDINTEKYKLAVKGGDVKVCALMACDKTGKDETCGVFRGVDGTSGINTKFDQIQIFTEYTDRSFRPYTLTSSLTAEKDYTFYFCQSDDGVQMNTTMAESVELKDIIAFGIRTASSSADSLNLILGTKLVALMLILKYIF